jgi:hypothetical protein
MERRLGRGDKRPLKEDDHAGKKYRQIQNVIRTMKGLDYPVTMLDHTRGYNDIFNLLAGADDVQG